MVTHIMISEKPWFVGYATRKVTSLTNARLIPGRSKRKHQQEKSPTPTSPRWINEAS
jgi:hypothetical protein